MGMGFSNLVPAENGWAEWVSLGTLKSSIFQGVILLTHTQPISAFPPSKWWFMMASYWRWAAKYTGLGVLEFWPSPNVQWTSLVFGRGRSVVSLSGLLSPRESAGLTTWRLGSSWIILKTGITVDTLRGYILLATQLLDCREKANVIDHGYQLPTWSELVSPNSKKWPTATINWEIHGTKHHTYEYQPEKDYIGWQHSKCVHMGPAKPTISLINTWSRGPSALALRYAAIFSSESCHQHDEDDALDIATLILWDLMIMLVFHHGSPINIPPKTSQNCHLFEGLQILHALGVVGETPHGLHDLIVALHDLQVQWPILALPNGTESPAKHHITININWYIYSIYIYTVYI